MSRPNSIALGLVMICLAIPTLVFAKQPETERLESLWANKQFEELQAIADQRLAENPDDPVGLIIGMNVAVSTDASPAELRSLVEALQKAAEGEQGWMRIVFGGYVGYMLGATTDAPDSTTSRKTEFFNTEKAYHSWELVDMLLARQACQERVARLNPIDLEALWKTRQDTKLREWADNQDRQDLAARLVKFHLDILAAEDASLLMERFKSLVHAVDERSTEFSSLSDRDRVTGFKRGTALLFAVLQRPDVTINDWAEALDNEREIVPPGISLANRLVRGC